MMRAQNDDNDLIYLEVENPIYRALLDHIMLEMEWARSDKNLYSFCWSIMSLPAVKKDDIKTVQQLLQDKLKGFKKVKDIRRFLDLEYILGLCLGVKILNRHRRRIQANLRDSTLKLLYEAKNRDWFRSHEFVSLVIYSLSEVEGFDDIVKDAHSWLEKKFDSFIKNHNFENIINCLFGFPERKKWLDQIPFSNILENRDRISDEGLSKLAIILSNSQLTKEASILVADLEGKLKDEFRGPLNPSLERGLREVISLSYSNCPPETMELILKTLKNRGVPWTDEVITKDKAIIIKKLPELSRFPKINPKMHALSFMALKTAGRSTVYQLDKRELEKAQNAIAQTRRGYFGIRRAEHWAILLVAGITSFFTFVFIVDIATKFSSVLNLSNIITALQEISQNWVRILAYGHYALMFYLWVYLIRILYALNRGGELKKSQLIGLIPLLGPIINRLLGRKQ